MADSKREVERKYEATPETRLPDLTRAAGVSAVVPRGVTELDAVYYCPYHPEHGVGRWRREHEDRKPGPGMLRRAAREFGTELGESLLVGDRCSDVAAANSAGLRQAFLLRGTEAGECSGDFLHVMGLAEVERWLEQWG